MIDHMWKSTAIGAFALAIASTTALAEQHKLCGIDLTEAMPDAVLTAKVTSVGFIAGVRWGDGVLTMSNGDKRSFRILGFKVLETGAAMSVIDGEVYNLTSMDDFEGTYLGASQKISIIKSVGEGVANNGNCVVVKYRAIGSGLQMSAPAPGGVEIWFND